MREKYRRERERGEKEEIDRRRRCRRCRKKKCRVRTMRKLFHNIMNLEHWTCVYKVCETKTATENSEKEANEREPAVEKWSVVVCY